MPTYEYECLRCGHRFEIFQSMSEPPRKRCPECRGKVRKLLGTGAGIIFKGSGFYATDYRSPGYTKAAAADKKPPSSPASESKTKDKGKSAEGGKTSSSSKKDT